MKKILILSFIILWGSLFSQIDPTLLEQLKNLRGLPGTKGTQVTNVNLSADFQNIENLNPQKYNVDAGDIFFAKIDVPGPDYISFDIPVTGEGYALLPQGNSIQVKGLPLIEVYGLLRNQLKKLYKNGIVEVFLKKPRNAEIIVNIAGLKEIGLELPATFYSSNIATLAMSKMLQDTSLRVDSLISKRFIYLYRKGKKIKIDLFKSYFYDDPEAKFYIHNEDYYYIPLIEDRFSLIYISGAINRPGYYEFKQGDTFKNLITFAGGLRAAVDSNRVEIYRRVNDSIQTLVFAIADLDSFKLHRGDRVFIRYKERVDEDWKVKLLGEVKFPGEYTIYDDKTTIYELIQMAGGFTRRASLKDAKILRTKYIPEDKEFQRLRKLSVEEMSEIERSYFKIRSRQDIRKVVCDFEKLFYKNKMDENITLRNGDIIIVPTKNNVILLSGGVMNPGIQTFVQNYNYKKYIELAGGFNPRALKNKIKIIKPKEGIWLDADEKIVLEPGDIIFVPEKEERDWWEMFKEGLTVVTQLGTLLVILVNLKKL